MSFKFPSFLYSSPQDNSREANFKKLWKDFNNFYINVITEENEK